MIVAPTCAEGYESFEWNCTACAGTNSKLWPEGTESPEQGSGEVWAEECQYPTGGLPSGVTGCGSTMSYTYEIEFDDCETAELMDLRVVADNVTQLQIWINDLFIDVVCLCVFRFKENCS